MKRADPDPLTRWFQEHVPTTGKIHIATVVQDACTDLGLGPSHHAAVQNPLKEWMCDILIARATAQVIAERLDKSIPLN